MTNESIDRFATAVADTIMRAGVNWICDNRPELVDAMTADDDLVVALRAAVSPALDTALTDMGEAEAANMFQVGTATFTLTMKLAGIEAAKAWAAAR